MSNINAINTAITGLKAQARALENISGNIANSQTAGFKKVETSFSDLIGDAGVMNIRAGAVAAYGRSTNDIGGAAIRAESETSLSIAGDGFFPVEGAPGQLLYTRRGDFKVTYDPKDEKSYLVNGSGHRLMDVKYSETAKDGIAQKTPIVVEQDEEPPKATSVFEYGVNLPQLPRTVAYDPAVPDSELLHTGALSNGVGEQALVTLPYGFAGDALARDSVEPGENVTVSLAGQSRTYVFNTGEAPAPEVTPPSVLIDATGTNDEMIGRILADMKANLTGAENAEAYLDGNRNLIIKIAGPDASTLALTSDFGDEPIRLASTPVNPPIGAILGRDVDAFMDQTVSGNIFSAYTVAGDTVPVQLRWGKLQGSPNEQWSLFYQTNSQAIGAELAWKKVGDYAFERGQLVSLKGPDGQDAVDGAITIKGLSVNGLNLGDIKLAHGLGAVTQYADKSGLPATRLSRQDGYGRGEFSGVSITETGEILSVYTNGQTKSIGKANLGFFSSPDSLERVDGQAFVQTDASGKPKQSASSVMAGWIETSNVDISEEFAKLIVTQQAYSANTRVVSTSDEMEKEALDLIR